MQVKNKVVYTKETDIVTCPNCMNNVASASDDDVYRCHSNWNVHNDVTTCTAEDFVICPKCGEKIMLATWTEEF